MRNEGIDFVGTDYFVGDRRLEEKILPLAQERKIGVMAYFPFDRGRLLQRASAAPLPEWAAEFGARTWAQFFLKYVLSHAGVTVVRTGTTKPARFQDPRGHVFEFQIDAQGKVTGAILEQQGPQGTQKVPLERR